MLHVPDQIEKFSRLPGPQIDRRVRRTTGQIAGNRKRPWEMRIDNKFTETRLQIYLPGRTATDRCRKLAGRQTMHGPEIDLIKLIIMA